VLFVISLLHFYWLFGGKVGTDRYTPLDKAGRRITVGKPLTLISAFVFLVAALIPLLALKVISTPIPEFIVSTALVFGVIALALRCGIYLIISFLQPKPRDIFHKWNIGLYTWICLFLVLAYTACIFY
jgi:hypothetical protein